MKIVQSYWSAPSQHEGGEYGRFSGGWLTQKHHYMSIALSCLSLKKHYPVVELITDTPGFNLLIENFQLPYSQVNTELNRLNDYHHTMWAAPKILTYSIQNDPFLHVDNDIYIWAPFEERISSAGLVVQNFEANTSVYKEAMEMIHDRFNYIPETLRKVDWQQEGVVSVNAGIFGGRDIPFIRSYTTEAFQFIFKNLEEILRTPKPGIFNMIFEQYLFYYLALSQNKSIECLFPTIGPVFLELFEMDKVPFLRKYIHLLGNVKKSPAACEQVEYRLQYEFPEYYDRINNYVKPNYSPSMFLTEKREASFQESYSRTISFIQMQKNDVQRIDTHDELHRYVELQKFEKPGLTSTFLSNIYDLDSARVIAKNSKIDRNKRFLNTKKLYDLFESTTQQEILALPFQLGDHVIIKENSFPLENLQKLQLVETGDNDNLENYYSIVEYKDFEILERPLDGWSKLLYYFQDEPLTGLELIKELTTRTDIGESYSREEIEYSVFEFITLNAVYDGLLIIPESYSANRKSQ